MRRKTRMQINAARARRVKSESHVWKSLMQASSISRAHHAHDLSHKKNTSDIMLPREIRF
jgi:hypothetical protein